jgi:hypothetical protein
MDLVDETGRVDSGKSVAGFGNVTDSESCVSLGIDFSCAIKSVCIGSTSDFVETRSLLGSFSRRIGPSII